MGDVGSGFLGFTFGALVWCGVSSHGADAYWLLLPLAPFILDATATLLRRGARGVPLTQAHRDHAYQRAVITGARHGTVALMYGLAAAVLALLAITAVRLAPLPPLAALAFAVVSAATAIGAYAGIEVWLTGRSRKASRAS